MYFCFVFKLRLNDCTSVELARKASRTSAYMSELVLSIRYEKYISQVLMHLFEKRRTVRQSRDIYTVNPIHSATRCMRYHRTSIQLPNQQVILPSFSFSCLSKQSSMEEKKKLEGGKTRKT